VDERGSVGNVVAGCDSVDRRSTPQRNRRSNAGSPPQGSRPLTKRPRAAYNSGKLGLLAEIRRIWGIGDTGEGLAESGQEGIHCRSVFTDRPFTFLSSCLLTPFSEALPMQPAVYLNFFEDVTACSNANGSVRTIVVTPKRVWGLGLNLSDFTAGLRIKQPDATFGITLKWQWSLDGKTWITGSTVISEKSAANDYAGSHNVVAEQLPFVRLIAEIRDTASAAQKTGQVSIWGYYRFRA